MVLDVHYTLTNKQHDLRESYVTENSMFVTEAQAVARYMDAN